MYTNVKITPQGKQYNFTVNGYAISFNIPPRDTVDSHPLDVLQTDLQTIVNSLERLERFKPRTGLPAPKAPSINIHEEIDKIFKENEKKKGQ